jgi:hypothetical protein
MPMTRGYIPFHPNPSASSQRNRLGGVPCSDVGPKDNADACVRLKRGDQIVEKGIRLRNLVIHVH